MLGNNNTNLSSFVNMRYGTKHWCPAYQRKVGHHLEVTTCMPVAVACLPSLMHLHVASCLSMLTSTAMQCLSCL